MKHMGWQPGAPKSRSKPINVSSLFQYERQARDLRADANRQGRKVNSNVRR
jgi:hypothetical protein